MKCKPNISVILAVFLFSIGDFLVTTLLQDFLHAPLFFDTIFMIAALFLFGPVAAFFEYLFFISFVCLKRMFLYGTVEYVYLFALSALTIIIVSWLFIRKKEKLHQGVNMTFLYILTAAMLSGLACSVVSGVIGYFTYSISETGWDFDIIIYSFKGERFDLLSAAILGRIPVIILDRIITTFAGFGVSLLYNSLMEKYRC